MVVVAPLQLVDTPAAFHALLARIEQGVAQGQRVAVDTEFHSEHRYRPKLLLVQIALEDGVPWLVDPVALQDLSPLGRALSPATLLIHAPGQDLPLLVRRCGLRPSQVIDPQVLAGFAGMGFPRSLGDLLRLVLGVSLSKGSTLSDWKTRPLSSAQAEYAADDVRYLHALVDGLSAKLSSDTRRWAGLCTDERSADALVVPPTSEAWRRFHVASRLDATSLAVLKRLAAWREQLARERNQPPRQIAADGQLLDLARRRPADIDALASNRRLPKRLLRDHSEQLLSLVQQEQLPEPPKPQGQDARARLRAAVLEAWLAELDLSLGIAPVLLLPHAMRQMILAGDISLGWRQEILKPHIDQVLSGERGVFFTPS